MEKFLNIQLFAGEDSENETPTNVENNNETPENDDVEFNDGEANEDTADQENAKAKENETSNNETKKKNAEAAQRRIAERQRRLDEENRRKIEEEKRKSYVEGIKNSTGGVNKFTNKPIVDDDDVEEYELMLKLDKAGKDPIEDYAEAVKEQKRNARLEAQRVANEKAKVENDMNADIDSFISKYGADTAQSISKDEAFKKYSNKFIGKVPLTDIYESWLDIQAQIETQSDKKAKEKDARRNASPGGLGKTVEKPFSWSNMSKEDFHKLSLEIAKRR